MGPEWHWGRFQLLFCIRRWRRPTAVWLARVRAPRPMWANAGLGVEFDGFLYSAMASSNCCVGGQGDCRGCCGPPAKWGSSAMALLVFGDGIVQICFLSYRAIAEAEVVPCEMRGRVRWRFLYSAMALVQLTSWLAGHCPRLLWAALALGRKATAARAQPIRSSRSTGSPVSASSSEISQVRTRVQKSGGCLQPAPPTEQVPRFPRGGRYHAAACGQRAGDWSAANGRRTGFLTQDSNQRRAGPSITARR